MRREDNRRRRAALVVAVVFSMLLAATLVKWEGLWRSEDEQYIEMCLSQWGTAHHDQADDMNMDPNSCPEHMPPSLREEYTMNGKIGVIEEYKCQTGPAYQKKHHYSQQMIEKTRHNVEIKIGNYYGVLDRLLYKALEEFPLYMKDVVVLGSQRPVYEAVCLVYGGRSCTTIDFQRITADDPRLRFLTVADYDKKPELFEVAISLSSFEHDGLGRYGDPLRPNGDLDMMKKMKCLVRPGGLLFLSVPVSKDRIVWNMHRIYGRLRLPQLLRHWKIEKIYATFEWQSRWTLEDQSVLADFEPLFVLRNEVPDPEHNERMLASDVAHL